MITSDQIKAARRLLGWSAATLAIKSKRTLIGVARAENGTLYPHHAESSMRSIRRALEDAGIEFIDGIGGAGVRLQRKEP